MQHLPLLEEMSRLTCSKPLRKPVRVAEVLVVHAPEVPQTVVLARSMRTASIFCATTHSSSNYDRSYNNSLKCLNQSSNKSGKVTPSWHR